MQLLLEVLVALAGALRLRLPEAAARVRQLLWIVRSFCAMCLFLAPIFSSSLSPLTTSLAPLPTLYPSLSLSLSLSIYVFSEAAARVRQLLWIVRQVVRSACGISKTFVLKVTHYLRPA